MTIVNDKHCIHTQTYSTVADIRGWLEAERKDRIEQSILTSEVYIIDRLIRRDIELKDVYCELGSNLERFQWSAYLETAISTAAFWSPDTLRKDRKIKTRLGDLNTEISQTANCLAKQIGLRRALCEESGFRTNHTNHIAEIIDKASERNGHYQIYLKKDLTRLRRTFDLKYWPSIDEIVNMIGTDSANANVEAADEITEAATKSRKASLRDFLRALSAAIEENSESVYGEIPDEFHLRDKQLASLLNCLLDLGPSDMVGDDYIKGWRHTFQN